MSFCKAVVLLVLLFGSAALTRAQGTYTEFDYPGASATAGLGIDNAGDVVGFYTDAAGYAHGFLLKENTYTTIDYAGAIYTYLFGINDHGQIVGTATTSSDTSVGFAYDVATQTFTTIAYPGATITSPYAISNAGIIGGTVNYQSVISGFELIGTKYARIAPVRGKESYVAGISLSGALAGSQQSGNTFTNFVFANGQYKKLIIPNAPMAQVLGANGEGTAVAGDYQPSPGTGGGFIYSHRTLTSLQFPGSSNTVAYGVNNAGEAVGYFFDASGAIHSYIWMPASAWSK